MRTAFASTAGFSFAASDPCGLLGWLGSGPASRARLTGSVGSPPHSALARRFSDFHRRVSRPRRRMALAVALVMGLPHRPDLPLIREEYTRIQVGERPGWPLARAQASLASTQRKRVASSVNGLRVAGARTAICSASGLRFPHWLSAGVEFSGIRAGVSGRLSVKLGPGRGALKSVLILRYRAIVIGKGL